MDTGAAGGAGGAQEAAKTATAQPVAEPEAEPATAAPSGPPPRGHSSRAPHFVKRSRTLHLTWQIGIAVVGFAIIVAGLAMMVLPGPGIPALLLGLAILGTEFVWAQRTLLWTKDQAAKAAQRALDPKTRRRNVIILIVGCVLIAIAAGLYLWKYGFALPS
ncbi:TIGR02611 family protein [Yinghuangia sp. ASG 101]|uniref:TIGR02611 family protein n=1 Tax=Yinghuangia sp. ASG 101 TaxID=2896848 RepID=UPI001E60EE6C|nr:TIGR02611 family protein [Yinghuangia sp. ASG 101]UGQ10640.1 TIGR02611 family protein [Yinghuangia sp. ASG 101]